MKHIFKNYLKNKVIVYYFFLFIIIKVWEGVTCHSTHVGLPFLPPYYIGKWKRLQRDPKKCHHY